MCLSKLIKKLLSIFWLYLLKPHKDAQKIQKGFCFRYHYISLPFTGFGLVSSSAQRVEDQKVECVEVKTFSFVNSGAFPKGKQTETQLH